MALIQKPLNINELHTRAKDRPQDFANTQFLGIEATRSRYESIPLYNGHTGESNPHVNYVPYNNIPKGVKIQLIVALQAAVSEIQASFQNCPIWI